MIEPTPAGPAPAPAPQAQGPAQPRQVDDREKALVKDYLERIEAAKERHKLEFKQFEINRQLLSGKDRDGKRLRANLYFANLATMRPQVYAKDPEYAVRPTAAVPEEQKALVQKFGETAEAVLTHLLIKEGRLKKRAKRLLTSAYTTSVGWLKAGWQESKAQDPLMEARLKDTQDNLERLRAQRQALADPALGRDQDLKIAELEQTLAGLASQSEVKVAKGMPIDFVLSEDILILDPSVREIGDYERASAIAHGVWMTREKYEQEHGYKAEKGRVYSEQGGAMKAQAGAKGDKKKDLLRVWEVWDQDSNRLFRVCEGEEGFCREPQSPDWTGERWYPFFLVCFNEAEGSFYPQSDVELTEPAIDDINIAAEDFKRDRKEALPVNLARKGGSLTPDDLERIKNRQGGDIIMVEGVGGQPITNDIFIGQLAKLAAENYDTTQARQFMEQIVGGGDAARGGILKAKTATEAEILSQGLRSRSSERQDAMEDMLTELGTYALQVFLRKLSLEEVQRIAGQDAVWPQLTADEVFEQVSLEVRGGSTGKPDKLQEQDRWSKLLPVVEKTMQQVSELRLKGQASLADALVELCRETLRRYDERIELDQFLPKPDTEGAEKAAIEAPMLQQKLQEAGAEVERLQTIVDKGFISAAVSVATSADPLAAGATFGIALSQLQALEQGTIAGTLPPPPDPGAMSALAAAVPPPENGAESAPDSGQPDAIAPESAPPPPEA